MQSDDGEKKNKVLMTEAERNELSPICLYLVGDTAGRLKTLFVLSLSVFATDQVLVIAPITSSGVFTVF